MVFLSVIVSFSDSRLRGLESFMCDLILEPEWVHRMFDMLCKGKLAMLDFPGRNGRRWRMWVLVRGFCICERFLSKANKMIAFKFLNKLRVSLTDQWIIRSVRPFFT